MGQIEASLVQPGWDVYSSDGERVGRVDDVEPEHFTMELEVLGGSSIVVPYDSVVDAADGRVDLELPAEEVGVQGWVDSPAT